MSIDGVIFNLRNAARNTKDTSVVVNENIVDAIRYLMAYKKIMERKGQWIRPDGITPKGYQWVCTRCGQTSYYVHRKDKSDDPVTCRYHFCPWCGAEMEQEQEE